MITIELKEDEITGVLERLARSLTDMSPVMRDIGDEWLVSTQDRLLRGEKPDGSPFAPRSQTTIARYNKLGLSFGLPLYQSGDMIRNISFAAGPDFVEMGTNAIQAAVMHFGAEKGSFGAYSGTDKNNHPYSGLAPWGNIPARPILGLSEQDRTNLIETVEEWLMRVAETRH